jgi:hypothetical protein
MNEAGGLVVTDPFEEYGKPTGAYAASLAKTAARREAKLRAKAETEHSAPMVGTPQEREERAKQQQFSRYLKSITLRKLELLEGACAADFEKLIRFLDQMTINTAPALVEAVKNSVWLSEADQKVKEDALWLIDTTIVSLRVKAGLSPFDDPIFEAAPNAFQIIRKVLTGVGQ